MACSLGLAHEAHRGKTRPAGCSPECRRAWAVEHHWGAARSEALERSGLLCVRCGLPTLAPSVHHVQPVAHRGGYRAGCQHHQENLLVLCPEHHADEDRFRRRAERVVAATGRVILVEQMSLPLAFLSNRSRAA